MCIRDSTYTAGLNQTVSPLGGNVAISGNISAPANVIISTSSAHALSFLSPVNVTLSGLTFQTTGSNRCISASGAGVNIFIGPSIIFGSSGNAHIFSNRNALVSLDNNYAITGSAPTHYNVQQAGIISGAGKTITLSGESAFSDSFAKVFLAGVLQTQNMNFLGTAIGQRYNVYGNGVINTNGRGEIFFPGSVAGSIATGGQYL